MARKKTVSQPTIPRCPWHIQKNMSYVKWQQDAELRHARRETQIQCPVCKLWLWADEVGTDPESKDDTKK